LQVKEFFNIYDGQEEVKRDERLKSISLQVLTTGTTYKSPCGTLVGVHAMVGHFTF
jgi:hypothetical protein